MKHYFVLLLLILGWQLSAQNNNVLGHKFTGQQIDVSTQPSIVTVNQPPTNFAGSSNTIPNSIVKHDVYLVLRIEHDKNYLISAPYKLDVTVQFSGATDANNNPLTATVADEIMHLEVNPFTGKGDYIDQQVIKLSNKYAGLHNVTAKLTDATQTIGTTQTQISLLPKEIVFELKSFTKYAYDLNASGSNNFNYLPAFNTHDVDGNGTYDYLEVFANYDGAEYYQIEWTYVNDYADLCFDVNSPQQTTKLYKSPAILNYDFKHNATRINIKNGNSYALPLVFDRGYLLIRTRGVGRSATDPNLETYTAWSIVNDAGLVSSLYNNFNPTSYTTANYTCNLIGSDYTNYGDQAAYMPNGMVYPLSSSHNENLIWQYSTTFAEEGKYKSVVAYFDASLHNRQSVTRVNSDKNIIVGETIYDNQGRPAVNVLPVPVTDPNEWMADPSLGAAIKFYPDFNKNGQGNPYSKEDFDKGNCTPATDPLGTMSGASKYYSPNADPSVNPYTPDAKQFPMSQVEYTPDGTGRVARQSGVGEEYNLNHDKATQYLYGQPDQLLLDRLFGSEVGDAAHYKYNVIIDANGQASIAYLDQEGRTVATALLADVKTEGPNNEPILESLISNPGQTTLLTSDLFATDAAGNSSVNVVDVNSESIKFTKQIVVPQNGLYEFDYSMVLDTVNDDCLKDNICLSCYYDLTMELRDKCGTDLFEGLQDCSPTITEDCKTGDLTTIGKFDATNPDAISFTCVTPSASTQSMSIKINLAPGEYFLSKTLAINQQHKAEVMAKYLDTLSNDCIRTITDLRDSIRATLPSGCEEPTCATCLRDLGPLDSFIVVGGTVDEYESLLQECNELCGDESPCKDAYELMLADMDEGGQYGLTTSEDGIFTPNSFALSVFNEANQLFKNKYAITALPYGPYRRPNSVTSGSGQGNWRYPVYFDENLKRLTDHHYMDAAGVPSLILIGTSTTPVNNFTYAINDPTQIVNDNGNLYVYPENLANVQDFLAKLSINESWLKSLVYLHPEFEYLEGCLVFDKKFNADEESTNNFDVSSNQFDSRMDNVETYTDAVAANFLINTGTALNPIFSFANTLNSYKTYHTPSSGFPYDPLLVNPGGTAYTFTVAPSYTSSNYSNEFEIAIRDFYIATVGNTTYTLSIMEMAAELARCPDSFDPADPNCKDFGAPNALNPNDNTIRDNEWNIFKSFYLNLKSKYIFKRENQWARNAYKSTSTTLDPNLVPSNLTHAYMDGCNACIGNSSYDITQYQFYSPMGGSQAGPPFLLDGACSYLSYQLYKEKQIRFPDANILIANNDVDQEYQHYLETGQCPIATDLENALNEIQFSLANNGGAYNQNGLNINAVLANTPLLKDAIYATLGVASAPSDIFTYDAVVTGSGNTGILDAKFRLNGVQAITLNIVYPYTATNFEWTHMAQFNNMFGHNALNPGDPNFSTYVKMNGAPGSSTDSVYTTCRGKITGISLSGCSFVPDCTPKEITRNIVNVMNIALTQLDPGSSGNNMFNHTNANLSLTYINNSPLLIQQFGTLNTFLNQTATPDLFTWNHTTSGSGALKYTITYNGATPYVELELVAPLGLNPGNFDNTSTTRPRLRNLRVVAEDQFEIDLYTFDVNTALETFVSTLKFKATTNGANNTIEPFQVGECELEDPLSCETPAHHNLDLLLNTATGLVNDLYNGLATNNALGVPDNSMPASSIYYPAELLNAFLIGKDYCATNEVGYQALLDNPGFYGDETINLPFYTPRTDVPNNTFFTKANCFGDNCGGPQYVFPDLFLANLGGNVSNVSFGTAFYDQTKLNYLSNKYGVVAVPLMYTLTSASQSVNISSHVYMVTCLQTEKCEVCPGSSVVKDCNAAPYTNIMDFFTIGKDALMNYATLNPGNNPNTAGNFQFLQHVSSNLLAQLITSGATQATSGHQVPYEINHNSQNYDIIVDLRVFNGWKATCAAFATTSFSDPSGAIVNNFASGVLHVQYLGYNSTLDRIDIKAFFNNGHSNQGSISFNCLDLVECEPPQVNCSVAPYTNIPDVAEVAMYAITNYNSIVAATGGGPFSVNYPLLATANQTLLNQMITGGGPATQSTPIRVSVQSSPGSFDQLTMDISKFNDWKARGCQFIIRTDGDFGFDDFTSIGQPVYNPATGRIEMIGTIFQGGKNYQQTIVVRFDCLNFIECPNVNVTSEECTGAAYTNLDQVKEIIKTAVNDYDIYAPNGLNGHYNFLQNTAPSFWAQINGGFTDQGDPINASTHFNYVQQVNGANNDFIIKVFENTDAQGCHQYKLSVPAPHSVADITTINSYYFNSATNKIEVNVSFSDNTSATMYVTTPCLTIAVCPVTHCPPVPPYEPPSVVGVTEVDPCAELYTQQSLEMAQQLYNEQLNTFNAYFNALYLKKCLGTFETFKKIWPDKEYHHTLYYYDQAGNLIKTIPPEGVRMLYITNDANPIPDDPLTSTVDESIGWLTSQQIKSDRYNNVKTLTTLHNMATVYKYNSLNQLTHQMMPDHDAMAISEFILPNGLDSRLHVTSTQFYDEKNGYLTGYINANANDPDINVFTRGYLYRTTTAGATWTRVANVVASDLKKIQMVTATTGYAVGKDGTVLKTSNGGGTWDWLDTYTITGQNLKTFTQFNDLHFISASQGIVVGNNGTLIYTNDGGATFELSGANGTGGLPDNATTFTTVTVGTNTTKTITNTTNNITGATYYAPGTLTSNHKFFVSTEHYKIENVIITDAQNDTLSNTSDTLEKYGEVYYSGPVGNNPNQTSGNYRTYTKVTSLTPNAITAADAVNADEFYLGTENGQLLRMLGLPAPAGTNEQGLVSLDKTTISYLHMFGPDRMICISNDVVYQSLDKGERWSRMNPLGTNRKYYAADAIDDNTIFFVGKDGIRAVAMYRLTGIAPNQVAGYGFSEQNIYQQGIDLRGVAAVDVSGNGTQYNLIACNNTDVVYQNDNATAYNSTWRTTQITDNTFYTWQNPTDKNFTKVEAIAEPNDFRIRGVLLSSTGKLFAFTAIKNKQLIDFAQPVLAGIAPNNNNFISLDEDGNDFVVFNNTSSLKNFIRFDVKSLAVAANQSTTGYSNAVRSQTTPVPPPINPFVPFPQLESGSSVTYSTASGVIPGNIVYAHYMDRANSSQVIIADNAGGYATATMPGTGTIMTFTDRTTITKFVALNDIKANPASTQGEIMAVGVNGEVYAKAGTTTAATDWKQKVSPITQILNSIAYSSAPNEAFMVANNAKAYDVTTSATAPYTYTPVSTGLSGNINDVLSVTTTGPTNQQVYFISSLGKVSKISNYGTATAALSVLSNTPVTGQPYAGISSVPGIGAIVVGNGCNIFTVSGTSSMQATAIHPPRLNDVSFLKNGTIGLVGGVKSFARRTNNASVNWIANTPALFKGGQVINITAVQVCDVDKGLYIDNSSANLFSYQKNANSISLVSGNNGNPANARLMVDLTYDEVNQRIYLLTRQSIFKIVFPTAPIAIIPLSSDALLTTPQLATGNQNTSVFFYQPNKVSITTTLPGANLILADLTGAVVQKYNYVVNAGSGVVPALHRSYVTDDYNVMVAGDNNNVFRVKKVNNIPLFANSGAAPCTSVDYTSMKIELAGDPNITVSHANNTAITALHFFDYSHGFIAGDITNVISSPYSQAVTETASNSAGRYVRLLNDESGFYSTRFWYDRLGRMIISQNSKQKLKVNGAVTGAFSYTLYDELGRIKEVGEKFENPTAGPQFSGIFGDLINNQVNPLTINDDKLNAWLVYSGTDTRHEVTQTYYDAPLILNANMPQENLRKRVSATTYEDNYDGNKFTYQHASHYTYDIHGNVSTLWQENQKLAITHPDYALQSIKQTDYNYDLISGKVNYVTYQKGKVDEYSHVYRYDDDNRLKKVYTIDNSNFMNMDDMGESFADKDAKYEYYKHGPLLRNEVGDLSVQGNDYVYTINGWIKGVNSTNLNPNNDIGKDGIVSSDLNDNTAKDAFGYALTYNNNDYKAIGAGTVLNSVNLFYGDDGNSDLSANHHNLYNGNITAMQTSIVNPVPVLTSTSAEHTVSPNAFAYRYDQLNRIKRALAFNNYDVVSNHWMGGSPVDHARYLNEFTYDANGNIITQLRNDEAGVTIDNLKYNYNTASRNTNYILADYPSSFDNITDGKRDLVQNRLYEVDELGSPTSVTDDIEDQGNYNPPSCASPVNGANNYTYDAIGNLIADQSEEIEKIEWTVYGKIKSITRTPASTKKNLVFDYDASGNRIAKHVYDNQDGALDKITYYTRDAQGNVMAVYDVKFEQGAGTFVLKERHMYGSSRLGINNTNVDLTALTQPSNLLLNNETWSRSIGNKQYEFSNHLGNVLSVVSDKKVPIASTLDPTIVDHYVADVLRTSDYYPFGAPLPGRQFSKQLCTTTTNTVTATVNEPFTTGTGGFTTMPNTVVTNTAGKLRITKPTPAGTLTIGAFNDYAMQAGTSCVITFMYNGVPPGAPLTVVASITELGNPLNTQSINISAAGTYTLNISVASASSIRLQFSSTVTGKRAFEIDDISMTTTVVSTITNCDTEDYRYGMNGKEKDDEIAGNGSDYDYGMRMYDSRLGKFLSVDPMASQYPWYSPYHFAGNNPIRFIDLDGLEPEDPPSMWLNNKGSKDWGDYYKNGGNLMRVADSRTMEKYWVEQFSDAHGHYAFRWYNGAEGKWQPFTPTGYTRNYLQEPFRERDLGGKNLIALADFFQTAVAVTTGVVILAPILVETGIIVAVEASATEYLATAGLRMAVDATAQAVVNGPENIDVADVAFSGFLTPGASAIFGGGVDWKPFSAQENKFKMVGGKKDLTEAMFDAGAKYTLGREGFIGSKVSALGGAPGVPSLSPIIQAPFNAAGKAGAAQAKKAIFGGGGASEEHK